MRIIINIDPIRQGKKRMRIRTGYQLGTKDGRLHIPLRNALVEFYNELAEYIDKGVDRQITDFIDEGERT